MEYNYYQHTNLLSEIQPVLFDIFNMYLNLLSRKLKLVLKSKCINENAYSLAYQEIESAFLIFTALQEPGTSFYTN